MSKRKLWCKVIKKITIISIAIIYSIAAVAQQDSHFSQGIFNQGYINPGSYGCDSAGLFSATVQNRLQTSNFDGAPNTTILNINGPLDFISSGVSLSVFNDKIGYLKTPGFNIGYSYIMDVADGRLGIGVSLGMINSKYDSQDWRLPDGSGGDVALPDGSDNATSFDMGAGVYYTTGKWYAGLSCAHLNRAAVTKNASKTTFGRTLYFTAGYKFALGMMGYYELRPSIFVGTDFGVGKYTANAHLFYKDKYWCGLSYRWDEAIVFTIGLELLKNLRFGYSYDYITTDIRKYSNGTHEFYVNYRFAISTGKKNNQRKSIRYL